MESGSGSTNFILNVIAPYNISFKPNGIYKRNMPMSSGLVSNGLHGEGFNILKAVILG